MWVCRDDQKKWKLIKFNMHKEIVNPVNLKLD